MKLFSTPQPADDGTTRPALDALRQQDAGTLAMTTEGLVDLSTEKGPALEPLDEDETEIEQAMRVMHKQAEAIETPRPYNAVTSSAWRILEEQRGHALDLVHECDAEIAKWTARRDDAQRAADGCLAGQKAMEV